MMNGQDQTQTAQIEQTAQIGQETETTYSQTTSEQPINPLKSDGGINPALLLIDKSILPSIAESERFIRYLNKRLNIGLDLKDLTINIHETSPRVKGYFRPKENTKTWCLNDKDKEDTPINSIVLSSHTLLDTPYETLAHEFAHYINHSLGMRDCSGNQYHNKQFKVQAERLLLKVEKVRNYGWAYTSQTPEFDALLLEFKPDPNAFKLFQNIGEGKQKKKGRMLLFMCGCGCKIRTARNADKPLSAVCLRCNSEFEEVQNE